MKSTVVAAFYHFVQLPDVAELFEPLLAVCQNLEIKGTILLAPEGINGTIAGSRPSIDALMAYLRSDPRLALLEPKESHCETPPFSRLKVRLKPEIVTLGRPDVDPSVQVGTYVHPQDWNDLIQDPTVTLVDVRNHYEISVGTFPGAQDPQTDTFREFPQYVNQQLDPVQHPKVAMFCTGGIRCEKASALLLQQGFAEVYHLQGGILKYLEEIPAADSLWQGECFVFDGRVSVDNQLAVGHFTRCQRCGQPLPMDPVGIDCPHCA